MSRQKFSKALKRQIAIEYMQSWTRLGKVIQILVSLLHYFLMSLIISANSWNC